MPPARFFKEFPKKPVIGMIHLAGEDPVKRALEEIALLEEEGVDAALVENYHGSSEDVFNTMRKVHGKFNIPLGVNILPNEFDEAFILASEFGAKFIQLDYVAGEYVSRAPFHAAVYQEYKLTFPDIIVSPVIRY